MQIYGTDRERLEREALVAKGFTVVCPNIHLSLVNDMDAYLRIVERCKRVVATEYAGYIGKGVFLEIRWALRHNIPVYVMRHGVLFKVLTVIHFNEDDWKTTYGQIGHTEPVKELV